MPPSIPRSKTFTGCWTCRKRSVKCDLTKPSCLRCSRTKRPCEGYDVRLVWVGQDETRDGTGQRNRRLFAEELRRTAVYSETTLDALLNKLEASEGAGALLAGPFSVFSRHDPFLPGRENTSPTESSIEDSFLTQHTSHDVVLSDSELDFDSDPYSSTEGGGFDALVPRLSDTGSSGPETGRSTGCQDIKEHVFPLLTLFLLSATSSERRLLRYWVCCTSGLFIPLPEQENPYRSIIIPLALASAQALPESSGHTALLHSVYANAASHLASRDATDTFHAAAASYHEGISLSLLRQSLGSTESGERESVLATMILLNTMECVNGTQSRWRVHMQGCRGWLRTHGLAWINTKNAHVLFQLFQCMELVGSLHESVAEQDSVIPLADDFFGYSAYNFAIAREKGSEYCLEKLFGIPQQLFYAIYTIGRLRFHPELVSEAQASDLDHTIASARPVTYQVDPAAEVAEKLRFHHAWVYHYACRIYFEREVRLKALDEVQTFVREGLYHLETINALEQTVGVSGLLWPAFVIACEAQQPDLRGRLFRIFDEQTWKGFGAQPIAAKAVKCIWELQDSSEPCTSLERHHLMKRMNFDVLLT